MLLDRIQIQAVERNENFAILAPRKQAIRYGTLASFLEKIGQQLIQWGFSGKDRLALVLPNGPEAATAFLAVSSVCACAPLNPAYPLSDFSFSMQDLGVSALITSFDNGHPSRKAAAEVGIPVIELNPDPENAGLFDLSYNLPICESDAATPEMRDDSVALVLHTSGTTSRPKIVPITHANLTASTENIVNTYQLGPEDRCLNMMPLFHVHGLIAAVAATLVSGGSVVCTPGFDPAHLPVWFHDFQPTWYTAVPTLHQAVLDVMCPVENNTANKLRFIRSCSSALSPQLAHALGDRFGVPVLEAYGMTEGTHQIASNPLPPKPVKLGSVGTATGSTKVAILDEQGNILGPGTPGEICIRGENVMNGYEKNPHANQSSFVHGWLRTGDQGFLDDEGYLFITGRIKELINRGGEKISPREIDEALQHHPAVKQAVAFPIPHPTLGEDVAAAVVRKPGQEVPAHDLRLFAAATLAKYKIPRIILFLEEIPKGPTGKVQRLQLAKLLKNEIDAASEIHSSQTDRQADEIERELITIWAKVLKLPQVGVEDDFLALGGDSLMAAQVLQSVLTQFGVNLTLADLYACPTIETMANLIREKLPGSQAHG